LFRTATGIPWAERARAAQRAFLGFPQIVPDLRDHIEAATLQTTCRRKGIQITTIDALSDQLAIGHDLEFLTSDRDFTLTARHVPLRILNDR